MTELLNDIASFLMPKPPKLSPSDQAQFDFLTTMNLDGYGAMVIEGQPRTGKSMFLAHLAYIRRKFFGYPVVSNNPLQPIFGEYELIDATWLAEELEKVNKLIDSEIENQKNKKKLEQYKRKPSEVEATEMLSLWERSGVKLYKSTTLWDEGGQDTDKRRGMASKNIALGHLCTQFGHYKNLICIVVHDIDIMDTYRQQRFLTHEVKCGYWRDFPRPYNKAKGDFGTSVYQVYHRHSPTWRPEDGPGPWNPQVITLEVRNWKDLFDTNAPVGMPRSIIKGLMKENKPL
jgi:hypothetical protein